tara:strand:- start:798 stop:1193 length:396 start_codon:yes stop_codon:yes gene_type:complete
MATKKITFDPTSGVPYGSNLTIYGGATFKADFNIVDTSNAAYDFSGVGWTAKSEMVKSVGVGATTVADATFVVGFTSAADGKFQLTLPSTGTTSLAEGRYVYNVLVSSGTTVYNMINGNVLVYQQISAQPS